MLLGRILRSAEGGEGGGGKAADEGTVTPPDKGGDKAADLQAAVEALSREHGSTAHALMHVLHENFRAREGLRERDARLNQLEAEVKKLSPYRDLGDLTEVKKALIERDEYRGKVDKFERRDFMAEVAKVSDYKASVLETLALRDSLKIEIVDSTEKGKDGRVITGADGRPVRVAIVRDDGDAVMKLADYAATHWGDFLPSLVVADEKKPNGTPTVNRQRIAPSQGQGSEQATKRRPISSF